MAKNSDFWGGTDFLPKSGDQLRKEAKNKIRGGSYYLRASESEGYEKVSGKELRKQAYEKIRAKNHFPEIKKELPDDVQDSHESKSFEKKESEFRTDVAIPNQSITLARCAEELCHRVMIINMGNRLYLYNGICYEPLNPRELATLYRDKVSNSLHGSRNMKMYTSELYDYLLSDSKLMREMSHADCSDYAFLENGIYDIRRQKLLPHDPRYIALSYVKARYIENPKCPKYDKFLDDITDGDKTLKKRFWQSKAYVLSQSTDAKKFLFMGTASDSGKSVEGKLMESIYPEKFVSNIALTDMNKDFALGPLVGSAVNISLDLPQTKLNNTAVSLIKQLTGNDSITINEKYIPQFKYYNRAKFIFASNHPITISGEDSAFWDRVLYLPFVRSIPKAEQNFRLPEELRQEIDAIVSKALHKGRQLWENKFEFSTTTDIDKTIRQWRGEEDDGMDYFINTCCELDGHSVTLLDNIYKVYCKCCEQRGIIPKNSKKLKDYLEEQRGLHHKKDRCGGSNPRSAMQGIRLL